MPSRPPRKPPARPKSHSPSRPKTDAPARKPPTERETANRVRAAWGVAPDRPEKREKPTKPAPRPAAPGGGKTSGDARPERPERPARPARPFRALRGNRGKGAGPSTPANPHPDRANAKPGEGPQRIAKLLARAGVASRREIERMIAEGRITINGEPVATPATLLSTLDGVAVDGQPVAAPQAPRLFLFHKPSGYLTAERDFSGRKTIYDRLPADLPRLMPVGRLDMNTEGLLLLTNDGELKRAMELPANGVERTYRARAFGDVSQAQLEELIHGIEIEGIRYGKIDANLERRTGRNQWIEMTLTEGKNREVRRVLEHMGLEVSRLIRTRYGIFELADLAVGAVVEVHGSELGRFLKTLNKDTGTKGAPA